MGIRHKRWFKWSLMLAVLFCLVLPGLRGVNLASDDPAGKEEREGELRDSRLHYIVRFWHADGSRDPKEDCDGYLEKEGDSETIKVEDKMKDNETLSGFSTAAGHDAVIRDEKDSSLTIEYHKDIHLAKVHVFYKSKEKEKEGKNLGSDETKVEDGTKYYNTYKEGLHTDKTAKAIGDSGRDFQLTLESWFVGGDKADVGMVLDASGSMAFTSNDLEPIKVDDDYKKMTYLSQEEVDKILCKDYTDNSKLAYSGYTYYVYDGASNGTNASNDPANEFVPIGYWNGMVKGDSPDFWVENNLTGYYSFDSTNERCNQAEVKRGERPKDVVVGDEIKRVYVAPRPSEGKVIINKKNRPEIIHNTLQGFNNTGRALDLVATYNKDTNKKYAAVLDINPNSDSFTISFAVNGSSSKPVVWIGGQDQTAEESQAWYAIYVDTDKTTTTVASGIGTPTEDVSVAGNTEENKRIKKVKKSITSDENGWAMCTYVFEKDSQDESKMNVIIYVNDKEAGRGRIDNINLAAKTNPVVLLGGSAWSHDYGGNDWNPDTTERFLLDELYFYQSALTKQEVEKYYEHISDPVSGTELYAATAPSDNNKSIAKLQYADISGNGSGAGWYLVSSDSNWDLITNTKKNLLTGKRYNGIPKGEIIYNRIENLPDKIKNIVDLEKGNTSDYILTGDKDFTGNAITKEAGDRWNGSIIFYIDAAGYLRCFYNSGAKQKRGEETEDLNMEEATWERNESHCSYVFKKDDSQRVKTEALQRALGSFVSQLSFASPESLVSAVRFSTENIKDNKQLVMMDWTNNTIESTGMLGLRRGEENKKEAGGWERTAIASSKSKDGKEQYNYVLTGGTATHTGLQAYTDNLDKKTENGTKNKTLIIFTDGKDTALKDKDGEQNEQEDNKGTQAKVLVDSLKADGYTIYCVMLQTAGQVDNDAMKFLRNLASGTDDNKDEYVFSADDVESLTEKFTEDILDKIVSNLPDYVIQDYIDPRFDLVNVDPNGKERIIHLNANGQITVEGKKKDESIDLLNDDRYNKDGYEINVTQRTDEDAVGTVGEKACLYYDKEKEMYYLKWQEQTIPGCNKAAARLNVWKTRIHVRAKEDFIGGNAILTNGNEANMNMVYHKDSKKPSSGKDEAYYTVTETKNEKGDPVQVIHYPSKGFQRTTVNVKLLDLVIEDRNETIYMGQDIDPAKQLVLLADTVENNVYYKYLERYAAWLSKRGDGNTQNPIVQLKEGKEVEIPYSYLPDPEGSNQTGGELHQKDPIGWLTYKWKECDSMGISKGDTSTYELFEARDTNSRYYQFSISYTPMLEKERKKAEEEKVKKLITDPDYGYEEVKPAKGDEQRNEVHDLGTYRTDIVRGELIVEARVLLDDLRYLAEKKKDDEGLNLEEQFPLTRSYNGIESPYGSIKVSFALTADELENMEPDRSGYVSLFSEPLEPLPLGIYTIQAGSEKIFTFRGISAKVITDGEGVFTEDYTAVGKESEFAAPSDVDHPNKSVRFYMGVSKEEGVAEVDLKAQLGHAVVAYAPLDRTEEPVVTPTPTPAPLPTPSSVPTPSPTVTPQVTPTPDPVLTPTPVPKKTPKPTPKPKKKKISGSTSSKPPSTNIDDKLPSGRKDLNDPNAGKGSNPGTGDPAEPGRAVLLLVVSTVIMASLILVRCRKRKS